LRIACRRSRRTWQIGADILADPELAKVLAEIQGAGVVQGFAKAKEQRNERKILNRDFQHPADGWYHIEPKGEHLNREAGVYAGDRRCSDPKHCEPVQPEADKPGFPGMLIDHEHFHHDADKETRLRMAG
jgi:hypothetical protein